MRQVRADCWAREREDWCIKAGEFELGLEVHYDFQGWKRKGIRQASRKPRAKACKQCDVWGQKARTVGSRAVEEMRPAVARLWKALNGPLESFGWGWDHLMWVLERWAVAWVEFTAEKMRPEAEAKEKWGPNMKKARGDWEDSGETFLRKGPMNLVSS